MDQPMLHLDGVAKQFDGKVVLHPLSLRIDRGKVHVLIGPSGCGKSTLLRLMIGLIRPDSGTVTFQGESVLGPNRLQLLRRMGYVIQEGGLFPHLTARKNVTLMARQLGWKTEHLYRRLYELAELVHLPADNLDRYPSQLSGGQRQRVSLMRALMLDPDLLLLDEPLGALDPIIRAGLQQELKEIFRTLNKTVVLVTHDMREAAALGDLVLLMRQGRIVQCGTIDQLTRRPAEPFVTEFLHTQPIDGLAEISEE